MLRSLRIPNPLRARPTLRRGLACAALFVLPAALVSSSLGCSNIREYKQASAEFDQYQDETSAKAEAGYQAGKAIHDRFMAEETAPPTTLDEAGPWYDAKVQQLNDADAQFASVQFAGEEFAEKAYETHLMTAAMAARLADEVFALEQSLSAWDYYQLHRSTSLLEVIAAAEGHFNAWTGADYDEFNPELGEQLRATIEHAEAERDRMNALYETSMAISTGEAPADEASGN